MNLKKITTEVKHILIVEDTFNKQITKEKQKEFENIYDTEIQKILMLGELHLYDLLINLIKDAEKNDDSGLRKKSLELKVLKLWMRKKRRKIKNKIEKKKKCFDYDY